MRLAIISDGHADVHALRDPLVQVERIRCDESRTFDELVDEQLERLEVLRGGRFAERNGPARRRRLPSAPR